MGALESEDQDHDEGEEMCCYTDLLSANNANKRTSKPAPQHVDGSLLRVRCARLVGRFAALCFRVTSKARGCAVAKPCQSAIDDIGSRPAPNLMLEVCQGSLTKDCMMPGWAGGIQQRQAQDRQIDDSW